MREYIDDFRGYVRSEEKKIDCKAFLGIPCHTSSTYCECGFRTMNAIPTKQ